MQHLYGGLIPGLWILWCVFWFVLSQRTKPTAERESILSGAAYRVPLFVGVWLLVAPHMPYPWLTAWFRPRGVAWFWLGVAFVVLGLYWSCLARLHLGRNWSSVAEVKQGHELIRTGPYHWTRHPIYTGLLLAVLGSALALGQWRGVLAVALMVASFLLKISIEERLMMARFPEEYPRYKAEVPALVPIPLRF
jgi:protein-S-isoprenylcysteine O-methyltransferase Ste14